MSSPGASIAPACLRLTTPCSTVARNFMSELDSLFNLDGGLENLDKTVLEKYASANFTATWSRLTGAQEAGSHNPDQGA